MIVYNTSKGEIWAKFMGFINLSYSSVKVTLSEQNLSTLMINVHIICKITDLSFLLV